MLYLASELNSVNIHVVFVNSHNAWSCCTKVFPLFQSKSYVHSIHYKTLQTQFQGALAFGQRLRGLDKNLSFLDKLDNIQKNKSTLITLEQKQTCFLPKTPQWHQSLKSIFSSASIAKGGNTFYSINLHSMLEKGWQNISIFKQLGENPCWLGLVLTLNGNYELT